MQRAVNAVQLPARCGNPFLVFTGPSTNILTHSESTSVVSVASRVFLTDSPDGFLSEDWP